jgi:hypothetical protein
MIRDSTVIGTYLVYENGAFRDLGEWSLAEAAGDPKMVKPDTIPVWVVRITAHKRNYDDRIFVIDMYRNKGQIERWRDASIAAARRQFHLGS